MTSPPRAKRPSAIQLDGIEIDALTQDETVAHVMAALDAGTGGLVLTVNTDILRQLRTGPAEGLLEASSLVVADGMPLVWASRIRGGRVLPHRVTGADLVWKLSEAAAATGRGVFLLGAAPGVAAKAAAAFEERFPSLRVVGICSPPQGFQDDEAYMDHLCRELRASGADLVFVALGFPKQDRVAQRLRACLPQAWFLGCGGALDMAAGEVPRAQVVLQQLGAEWVHRLVHDPRRLARRYLVDDLPYAIGLVGRALGERWSRAPREGR